MSVRWITTVWQHSPYRAERLLVHLALADFANDEGLCWPSQKTLAFKARCSINYVRLTVQQMEKDGLLTVKERAGGRGRSAQYILQRPVDNANPHPANGEPTNHHSPEAERPFADEITPLIMNRHEPSHSEEFDAFWSAYPRKVGKGAARKAFVKAMSGADAPALDDLLAAVRAYAASIRDMNYCAHPTTWLKQERWSDTVPVKQVRVEVPQEIQNAWSRGAACRLAGTSPEAFEEMISHLPEAQKEASREYYYRKEQ